MKRRVYHEFFLSTTSFKTRRFISPLTQNGSCHPERSAIEVRDLILLFPTYLQKKDLILQGYPETFTREGLRLLPEKYSLEFYQQVFLGLFVFNTLEEELDKIVDSLILKTGLYCEFTEHFLFLLCNMFIGQDHH